MSWVGTVIEFIRTSTGTKKTDADLKKMILQAILEYEGALGINTLQRTQFTFRPYDAADTSKIDDRVWENAVNITIADTLRLTDSGAEGSIEMKSVGMAAELGFVRVRVNKKGSGALSLLSFDLSGDKPRSVPDGNMGTWFVADGVLAPFGADDLVDVSGVVVQTFSLKLTLGVGAPELTDMTLELYAIPSKVIGEHLTKLRDTVCALLYEQLHLKAVENGNEGSTIAAMERMRDTYKASGLGVLLTTEGGRTASTGSGAVAMRAEKSADGTLSSKDVQKRDAPLPGDIPAVLHDRGTHTTAVLSLDSTGFINFP